MLFSKSAEPETGTALSGLIAAQHQDLTSTPWHWTAECNEFRICNILMQRGPETGKYTT